MTGFEDTAAEGSLEHSAPAAEVGAPDQSPAGGLEHPWRTLIAILLGIIVVAGAAVGAWFWNTAVAPVTVPELVGLTPASASKVLSGARLADGRATYSVTKAFPQGHIVAQSPAADSSVRAGTPVDVSVAVAPVAIPLPDLVQSTEPSASALLEFELIKPQVVYAYSKAVEINRVIEMLPRAGDTVQTGSTAVLVVSLGPGTSGKVVPSLIGQPSTVARSEVASAALFAQLRPVDAPNAAVGTVVDQAPSAGTVVPVATNITLSVATGTSNP